jgi:hypothetical protein
VGTDFVRVPGKKRIRTHPTEKNHCKFSVFMVESEEANTNGELPKGASHFLGGTAGGKPW